MIHPSLLLRRAIQLDALVSGAMAALLTIGAGALAPLLNLPELLLRQTGLLLIVYAALVGWLGARALMPKPLVVVVIAGNALWVLGSVALLLSEAVAPSRLGIGFVLMQAIAVGGFAELQFIGLRRSRDAMAA
uniref:Integral membrane protein n=1 Tax=Rhodopseudomonas palustris (strain BisA53) TaxID=316055 RepID=Q07RA6_RHOP5